LSEDRGGHGGSQSNSTFTLFSNEERVLDDAERMIRSLEAVGDGVNALAKAYRRSYDEQRRLLRLSDRVQADLQSANQRLSEKTNELQQLNEQLREANEQKDLLFSIIGHDLRNPFSIVSGYTRYIQENAETLSAETIRDMAGRAYDASSAVSRLLDTLLEWARVQNDQMQCNLRSVELQKLIKESLSLYDNLRERKSIEVNMAGEPNTLALADPDMTSTIFRNLFNNAFKFTPTGGSVTIDVRQPHAGDEFVPVMVTDTGGGIPEERLANLFTPNTGKAQPGTHGEKGLGLGLPICKQLAERQGGHLTVGTRIGEGSTFTLYLRAR
jgi:signal transduction histidine kinase